MTMHLCITDRRNESFTHIVHDGSRYHMREGTITLKNLLALYIETLMTYGAKQRVEIFSDNRISVGMAPADPHHPLVFADQCRNHGLDVIILPEDKAIVWSYLQQIPLGDPLLKKTLIQQLPGLSATNTVQLTQLCRAFETAYTQLLTQEDTLHDTQTVFFKKIRALIADVQRASAERIRL